MRIPDLKRTAPKILLESQGGLCLVGPPGVGKTSVAVDILKTLECTDIFIQHPATKEPVDYLGMIQEGIAPSGKSVMHWLPPGDLPLDAVLSEAQKKGGHIGIILDDFQQAHPQVQNPLSRAFYESERLIGPHKLAPNVLPPIATTNRQEDAAAVFEMPSFARMRMTFVNVDVDAKDWCQWAYEQKDVPEEFIGFVNPEARSGGSKHIHDFEAARQTNCSPRTLHIAGRHWTALKNESPNVIDEYLSGVLCPAFAPEFRAYYRLYDQLPDVHAILKGEEVKMDFVQRPDVLCLVINSLIKRADEGNLPHLAEFMFRLPKNSADFGVWMYQAILRRFRSFSSLPEVWKWAEKNKAVLHEAIEK